MIYTVTLNPAIDYLVHMDCLRLGTVNRTTDELVQFGGKGINVSVLLRNLGIESTVLGFIAGFTGDALEDNLIKMGIKTSFVKLSNGLTRINVKIKSQIETDINAKGPDVNKEEIEKLFYLIEQMKCDDILILSGSIPSTLTANLYSEILSRLTDKKICTIVDAEGDLLCSTLKYKPFLIKPNHIELAQIFNKKLETDDDIIFCACELKKMGAKNVLVSMAGKGALLLDEFNNIHRVKAINGTVKNSVGAGDSMVAGFLAGYLEFNDYTKALYMGVAAGSATAFSDTIAQKHDILRLYDELSKL